MALSEPQRMMKIAKTKCCVFNATVGYFRRSRRLRMSFLRNITSGLRSLFRKEQVDRELDEELRAYQEMAVEEKIR
jgi:hypothetical protein